MAEESNSGCGWIILIVVVALIGAGYLYQREGGRIFDDSRIAPPTVLRLQSKSTFATGLFTHDLTVTNESGRDLQEVNLTLTLFREDRENVTVKRYWPEWKQGEAKIINVPAYSYPKVTMEGTAMSSLERVVLQDVGTWAWNKE